MEDVPVSRIAAEVGTPVYIYSASTFRRHAQVFREGLSALPRVHLAYAIKANPNIAVLRVLADEGYGADVVSVGEMRRALAAGMKAEDIVFSASARRVPNWCPHWKPGSASSTWSWRKRARSSPSWRTHAASSPPPRCA